MSASGTRPRVQARTGAVRTERCMRVLMTGESDHPRAAWHRWLLEDLRRGI